MTYRPKKFRFRHKRNVLWGRPLENNRRNFTKFLNTLAVRLFGTHTSSTSWTTIYSPVTGPIPERVNGLDMPTTVDEVLALNDDQLGRVLRAAGACSHNPGNGTGFNRFEMLGMIFALTGSRPEDGTVWTNAPNVPVVVLPPRTAEQAVTMRFN
ncbi:hypothetical protein BJ508DRAFT_316257 [Ascobolus immersus RN42]|uniref:Uncharacterized protein n=1 Tax=Ascobolus immersus RN42 TaxID=1160509 RepID=A0A3N4HBC6_ASCIM|nr:hypothetical protein BJ508DRAFT_316257 [Ascobolus immersus RN42]